MGSALYPSLIEAMILNQAFLSRKVNLAMSNHATNCCPENITQKWNSHYFNIYSCYEQNYNIYVASLNYLKPKLNYCDLDAETQIQQSQLQPLYK